jgi:hypothetical protein
MLARTSTPLSLVCYAYQRLKRYLGLSGPVRVQTERSLLAWPDDAVLELFDMDLRLVVAHTAIRT